MSFGSWTPLTCLALLCIATVAHSGEKQEDNSAIGVDALYRLDLLPSLKQSAVVGSFSSYDRTGGNDDGFSGKYSFLREDSGGKVVAEMEGPGAIYRIWTATPNDDIVDFYFDGESKPRLSIKFSDMFTGKNYPFVAPLAGYRVGGYYSYAPVMYAKSCKVVVRGGFLFYQINYAQYPQGTPIKTFELNPTPDDLARVEKVREVFAATGKDVAPYTAPPGARVNVTGQAVTVAPGKTATLFSTAKPGRIVGLRLTPAEVFNGDDRGLLLRVTWDDEEKGSWVCPVGDFFGYAWGDPATRSLLVGTVDGTNYCYFPMPFDRSAKLEVVSTLTSGLPSAFYAEVMTTSEGKRPDEGKFYAVWHRENPTTKGKPFTFVEATGRGKVVGSVLQAQGDPYNMGFFEGDDQTTIDSKLAIHGTGSEDFFNGGWYDVPGRWIMRESLPLSGCLGYQMPLGRTGGYRLMLSDAYPYEESIHHAIEHDAEANKYINDYCGVCYLYANTKPNGASDMPSPEALAVVTPKTITFRNNKLLLNSFDGDNAAIKRGQDGGILFTADGEGPWGNAYITFTCDMPDEGDYKVSMDAFKGPVAGLVQLSAHDRPAGEAVDLYAGEHEQTGFKLGAMRLKKGMNTVMLKLVGKNDKSSGMGLEIASLTFTKVE